MIKQLYKRKIAVLLGLVFLGGMSAIAQESQTEEKAAFLNEDQIIGDKNAPVEIIEYASLTCSGCANFHNNVYPEIKKELVDTGKAKFVIRNYSLNGIDARIAPLTRCVSEKRYPKFVKELFKRQSQWYDIAEYQRLVSLHGQEEAFNQFTEYTLEQVQKIARQVGLNKKKIEACLSNEAIGEYLFNVQAEGKQKYNIQATPTVVVNGRVVDSRFSSIEKAVENEIDG